MGILSETGDVSIRSSKCQIVMSKGVEKGRPVEQIGELTDYLGDGDR